MKILIDADGCPVVDITVTEAVKRGVACTILCDTSHIIHRDGASTITCSKAADSVDFALVGMVQPGDVVITQDFGLAAMCLARKAVALNQNGLVYTDENIDGLLMQRYMSKRARMAGQRLKGSSKRTAAQNESFKHTLNRMLDEILDGIQSEG